LKLSWTTPSDNGGSSIIGYKIQRASTSWVDVVNNTGSTLTNYNVTSLAANSVYKFHIAAWNDVGLGTYSSNITGYTLPNSPTSLTATTISSSQINLSWTAPTGGNGTLNGYKIESSTNGGSTWSTIVANTTNTGTTYSNTGLASGTTYTYRVSALNGGGASSPSSTASATTSGTLSSWHSSTGILEPLYCGPYVIEDSSTCKNENGTNDFAWLDINDTKNKYPHVPYFVIVNPNSGPGSSLSSDYQRGIANLTKSGVIVLGYVHTSYDNGQVPYSQARNWVDEWVNWYSAKNSVMGNLGIKGIFLDEMSNNPTSGNLTYYGNLTNYIHGNLTYSIGNPGVETVP
ncbi:MAG: fibronectin type III domain-containing protein, partial [Patescibacteria group bacterium]|nr:fibronectin type III domain-containing protein [Patescibacteria group bacterium]